MKKMTASLQADSDALKQKIDRKKVRYCRGGVEEECVSSEISHILRDRVLGVDLGAVLFEL